MVQINGDNECEPLITSVILDKIHFNITVKDEHIPVVECRIHVIKEWCRALRHTLPFTCITRLLIVNMVKFIIRWINAFPSKGGLFNTYPRLLLIYKPLDYMNHCHLTFGSYVQTHDETHNANSIHPRTTGSLDLGPDNSTQGGYYFFLFVHW